MKIENASEIDMARFAAECAESAKAGDIFCLTGAMGAGKTVFAKAFARAFDVSDTVNSPTFTILNEYAGKLALYHFDVFRLNSPDEVFFMGLDEYFDAGGVCLIEWGEKIARSFGKNYYSVVISPCANGLNSRGIEFTERKC